MGALAVTLTTLPVDVASAEPSYNYALNAHQDAGHDFYVLPFAVFDGADDIPAATAFGCVVVAPLAIKTAVTCYQTTGRGGYSEAAGPAVASPWITDYATSRICYRAWGWYADGSVGRVIDTCTIPQRLPVWPDTDDLVADVVSRVGVVVQYPENPEGLLEDTQSDYAEVHPADDFADELGTEDTAELATVGSATGAQPTRLAINSAASTPPNCGSKFGYGNRYHSSVIRRTGAGVDNAGHQYIQYHLHFQTKTAWQGQTREVLFQPYYTNMHSGKPTREKVQSASRQHPNKPFYYHVTRRVKPGQVVGFDAAGDFEPPVDGRVEGTTQLDYECVAR